MTAHLKGMWSVTDRHVEAYQQACRQAAAQRGVEVIVTGHIHMPQIAQHPSEEGAILYLNSGDWVESLSALEYDAGEWSIARWQPATTPDTITDRLPAPYGM